MTGRDYDRMAELRAAITPVTLAAWMRSQLAARGMSQADGCRVLDIHRSTMSRLCRGVNVRRQIDTIAAAMALMGIDVRELPEPAPPMGAHRMYPRRDICTVPGCDKPYRARGWCATHYGRWREWGDPTADLPVRRRA